MKIQCLSSVKTLPECPDKPINLCLQAPCTWKKHSMKETCRLFLFLLIGWTAPSLCALCNANATGFTPLVCLFFCCSFVRWTNLFRVPMETLQIDFQIGQTYRGYPGFLYNDSNAVPPQWRSYALQVSSNLSVSHVVCVSFSVFVQDRFNRWIPTEVQTQAAGSESQALVSSVSFA